MRERDYRLGLAGFLSSLSLLACSSDSDPSPAAGGGSSGASPAAGSNAGGQGTAGTTSPTPTAGSASVAGTGAGGAGASSSGGSAGNTGGGGATAGSGTGSGGAGGGTGGGSAMLKGTPIVFVGGFGSGYPLRAYNLDKTTGALTQRGSDFDAGTDPSYLALDPSRTHLYAANENDGAEGGITALKINTDGSLTKLNHQTGSDLGFTHVAVDPTGKYVLGASYNGGSVSVFPINSDGSIGAQADNVDFGGSAQ